MSSGEGLGSTSWRARTELPNKSAAEETMRSVSPIAKWSCLRWAFFLTFGVVAWRERAMARPSPATAITVTLTTVNRAKAT